jgi:hypothetical protein
MQLSKSLLQAIAMSVAVGTVGTTATSCSKLPLEKNEQKKHQCTAECGENCEKAKENETIGHDCPACGMG